MAEPMDTRLQLVDVDATFNNIPVSNDFCVRKSLIRKDPLLMGSQKAFVLTYDAALTLLKAFNYTPPEQYWIYELSSRFKGLRDPAGAITWARELMGVSKKLLTPTVVDAVIDKVAGKRITNSKDLRKLRQILPDPVAREHFLSKQGDIDSAVMRLGVPEKKDKSGLAGDLESAIESMKRVPWTALSDLKGDPEILKKIDDAEPLLKSLRKALSS